MKIRFEYTLTDGCYGYIDLKEERVAEAELKDFAEVGLTPCKKRVKVTALGEAGAELEFPDGQKLKVNIHKTPFKYSEFYESFGDSRYHDLSGTVQIIED